MKRTGLAVHRVPQQSQHNRGTASSPPVSSATYPKETTSRDGWVSVAYSDLGPSAYKGRSMLGFDGDACLL